MRIKTETAQLAGRTHTAYGWSERTGVYAFAAVYNALAAMGADCLAAEAYIAIPAGAGASQAGQVTAGRIRQGLEKGLRKACAERGVELTDVRAAQNPLLSVPSVTVTGAGMAAGEGTLQNQAGAEIVLTKWIGMEGMLRIAEEREEELRQRFAPVFLRQIQSYRDEIFAGKELETARQAGITTVRQVAEGGIFAALWGLSKETGMGLDLDMKQIPVLQETIEVCECYRLNPYLLTSAGSFLMAASDGRGLADTLHKEGIAASVIGRLTSGNDKVIHNGGDLRCLDRPAPDEIYRLFL